MAKAPPERKPPHPARKTASKVSQEPSTKERSSQERNTKEPSSRKSSSGEPSSREPSSREPSSKKSSSGEPSSREPSGKPSGKAHTPQPAFPKKNQPPTAGAFAARLPLALGKRFDFARGFLSKQPGVREDVYFYGPESGWALRYLLDDRPLCSLHVYDEQPVGIVSLDPAASAGIDWRGLSPAGLRARKQAHGSPTLLWLDVPLEGTGAADFRALLRAKLAATARGSQSQERKERGDDADEADEGGD